MHAVLLVIHLIVSMGIIAVVLIQPSEAGGFLGSGGSMSNALAPRRSADVLTRVTAGLAATFFLTSLLLAVVASHRPEKHSILDAAPAPAASTAPAAPAAPAVPDPVKKKEAVPKATPKKTETPTAPVSK